MECPILSGREASVSVRFSGIGWGQDWLTKSLEFLGLIHGQ